MCTLCGCGADSAFPAADKDHHQDSRAQAVTGHHHTHDHKDDHSHPSSADPAHPEQPASTRIRVERDLLAQNNRHAAGNRSFLAHRRCLALNILSSPGSGKTTLLEQTVSDLRERLEIAVIEGDQETTFDADRVRAAGVKAVQINTGKICHLDAHMIGHALEELDPSEGAVVFIENVGNLVCPSAFDLGEARKVVLLSVTEGDDKPMKYKDMFAVADVVLVTKIDLLPYVRFDLDRCRAFVKTVNPRADIIEVSPVSGVGLDQWYSWISASRASVRNPEREQTAPGLTTEFS
ncbi:MAG: hydrogenase nickel incorporation protein HypB [Rhodospirillales bacterium]|nr:hydrogenase nickel incorporation protein HypB [Rhodospirillales bacterium]